MSNGGDGGGGDTGGGSGGVEAGGGVGDSPWFAGAGGAVGVGVDGFNSLASTDADSGTGDQQPGADATAANSTESSEGSGEGEEEDTSTSEGEGYDGSDTEESDSSEGSEGEDTSTSDGQDDGGSDTEGGDNSEGSEGEGTEGDSDSEGNTQNTESTAESNPAGAPPPDSSIMQESKRRGRGPVTGENDDDSKHSKADKRLDEQQARSQEKDAESTDGAQKAEANRREQPIGDNIGQAEKSRLSAEQTSKKALFGQQEGQDIQDNSPVRRPDSGRGRGTILGVRPEDLWKHKGGSAAPRGDFLPKGGGSRYSDGKQPIGASDKISTEMERLKAHTEAVSSWNSEAVSKYKERLLKDPGAAGELARRYQRLEHPGVG